MNPVSAAELASIRSALTAAVCDTSCTIKHVASGSGTYGETTETESAGTAVLAGLEEPSGGLLTTHAELIASQATWVVHFPYGTDVRQNDNLYISTKKLKVQELLDLRSMAGLTDVLATEIA